MKILFTGDCRIDGPFRDAVLELPAAFGPVDAFVMNAEFAVTTAESGAAKKSAFIKASPDDIRALAKGVPCQLALNVANNHSEDAGADALKAWTAEAEASGTVVVGNNAGRVLTGPEGRKLGLLSYTMGSSTGAVAVYSPGRSADEIRELKQDCDAVAVLMHWGEEHVYAPSPEQKRIARELVSAGADIVIGSHPHVLQGLEQIQGCPVFYSLGNTVFRLDDQAGQTMTGGVVVAELTDAGLNAGLHPISLDADGRVQRIESDRARDLCRLLAAETEYPSGMAWYRKACGPFFRNHMASWHTRIRKYGPVEAIKMIRAFLSPYYMRMSAAWLSGGFRDRSQANIAEKLERIACREH